MLCSVRVCPTENVEPAEDEFFLALVTKTYMKPNTKMFHPDPTTQLIKLGRKIISSRTGEFCLHEAKHGGNLFTQYCCRCCKKPMLHRLVQITEQYIRKVFYIKDSLGKEVELPGSAKIKKSHLVRTTKDDVLLSEFRQNFSKYAEGIATSTKCGAAGQLKIAGVF